MLVIVEYFWAAEMVVLSMEAALIKASPLTTNLTTPMRKSAYTVVVVRWSIKREVVRESMEILQYAVVLVMASIS
jgi:hypothetical protein